MKQSNPGFHFFCFFLPWRNSFSGPRPPLCGGFTITLRHTTLGRTPLDERSARHKDLYRTTHNTHNGQTSMSPVGFEPTISAGERPQTHALDRATTGIGFFCLYTAEIITYKLFLFCICTTSMQ